MTIRTAAAIAAAVLAATASPALAQSAPAEYGRMFDEQEGAQGQPLDDVPLQQQVPLAPAPLTAAPAERGPASKQEVRALQKRLEGMASLYQTLGRCTAFLTPDIVAGALGRARGMGAASGYILSSYERGFRSPKGEGWCVKRLGTRGTGDEGRPED